MLIDKQLNTARLGANTTIQPYYYDDGLGIDPATILATVTGGLSLGKKIFGGKSQSQSCKQRQQEVANLLQSLFTTSELYELSNKLDQMESSDHGSNPEGLAYEYIGGKNCKIENDGKRQWVGYVNQRIAEKQKQMTAQSGFGKSISGLTASIPKPLLYGGAILITGGAVYMLAKNNKI